MSAVGTTLIDGEWGDPHGHCDVVNPVDGSVVGWVGYGGRAEATAAADAAARAFAGWSKATGRARAAILRHAGELVARRAESLGTILAWEAGKRLPEAVAELRLAAAHLRRFAAEADHRGDEPDARRRAAGVVASLTPWSFPCAIQAGKVAPALAAGCTVVARVSERAPLAVTELFRCLTDAGLPPGVLNLVHGPAAEVTGAYLGHPAVRVVSFTGSPEVGRSIRARFRSVRPLLELGGKAPFIVFEDADLDAAVEGAMPAKFGNAGQSGIGADRFLVHADVQDEFVGGLAAAVDAMSLGDGTADPLPDLGPCITPQRARAVRALVAEALAAGAKKVTRDFDLPGPSFAEPAILVDVPEDVGLAHQEVFGPAAGVFAFRTDEEAIALANSTGRGMAAYVYTRDRSRASRVAERLNSEMVGLNQAGFGPRSVATGLSDFSRAP